MKCKKCGKEIHDNEELCTSCKNNEGIPTSDTIKNPLNNSLEHIKHFLTNSLEKILKEDPQKSKTIKSQIPLILGIISLLLGPILLFIIILYPEISSNILTGIGLIVSFILLVACKIVFPKSKFIKFIAELWEVGIIIIYFRFFFIKDICEPWATLG